MAVAAVGPISLKVARNRTVSLVMDQTVRKVDRLVVRGWSRSVWAVVWREIERADGFHDVLAANKLGSSFALADASTLTIGLDLAYCSKSWEATGVIDALPDSVHQIAVWASKQVSLVSSSNVLPDLEIESCVAG